MASLAQLCTRGHCIIHETRRFREERANAEYLVDERLLTDKLGFELEAGKCNIEAML